MYINPPIQISILIESHIILLVKFRSRVNFEVLSGPSVGTAISGAPLFITALSLAAFMTPKMSGNFSSIFIYNATNEVYWV